MTSLWNGIVNYFREKKDQAAEAVKDDVRDGKFAIEDSEKEISGFETKIGEFSASIKKQKKEKADADAEIKKWGNLAQKAADDKNEADVTACVLNKQNAEKKSKTLEQQILSNENVISSLKKQLDSARNKVSQAKSNFTQLKARKKGAEIRQGLAQASSQFGEKNSALARLQDLEEAVVDSECKAEALEEMAVESDPMAALEEKYSGTDQSVTDEVARLMGKKE